MPNIRQLEAPANIGLNPTETGIDAVTGAARREGAFYNQIAETYNQEGSEIKGAVADAGQVAVNYMDHREISAGAANGSKVMAGLTDQWNKLISNPKLDPNDPSIKQKFLEETVEPTLDQFKQGFNTEKSQAWAENFVDQYRNHMVEKTSADISSLARVATERNINDTVVAKSNMAISDPSSVPFLINSVKNTVGGMIDSSPTLSPIDKANAHSELESKTIRQIVQSGAIGAIQKSSNPEATADEWISKYPDYISGADAKTLANNARQQLRYQNYDFELNRRRQKEVATDRSNEATNQYLIDVRSQDPKLANDPTAKKILNDTTLTKTDKNNLLNYVDRQLKPETESRLSQGTFVNLLRDLRAPDADTDAVMQKAWDARLMDPGKPGSMSEKDFNQFRQEVVARKTPEGAALESDRSAFFKNYAPAIVGQSNYQPGYGDPKIYNAEMDARRVETDLKKKGLDPHLAYDPSSQYFLGKPERVEKWAHSMQQDLQTRAAQPGNGLPAQKDITGVQNEPAPVATSTPRPAAAKPPEKGFVKDGYEFLGGNPGEAGSWKKVEERS